MVKKKSKEELESLKEIDGLKKEKKRLKKESKKLNKKLKIISKKLKTFARISRTDLKNAIPLAKEIRISLIDVCNDLDNNDKLRNSKKKMIKAFDLYLENSNNVLKSLNKKKKKNDKNK